MTVGASIVNRQRARRVDARALLAYIARLVDAAPRSGADTFVVCLVSDAAMIRLQRRFRGRATTTDVLSFPAGDDPAPDGELHLGDIAVSVPQAARQARARRRPLARELERLVLHGYLHLLGYDHETDDGRMERLERRLERRLAGDGRRRRADSR